MTRLSEDSVWGELQRVENSPWPFASVGEELTITVTRLDLLQIPGIQPLVGEYDRGIRRNVLSSQTLLN
jgi:hypothetical protein